MLLFSWNFPGKNTGVDCHCLLHWDIPDRGLKSPYWQVDSLPLKSGKVPNKDKEEEHFFQWNGDKDFIFRFIIEHSDRDIQ